MAVGIRVAHDTQTHGIYLVPCAWMPLFHDSLRPCPTCQIIHPVKTIHLYLEGDGTCLVSEGVFKLLQQAGMPELSVVGDVKAPPALDLSKSREQVDQKNRKIVQWSVPQYVTSLPNEKVS